MPYRLLCLLVNQNVATYEPTPCALKYAESTTPLTTMKDKYITKEKVSYRKFLENI